ncbi:MAG: hypothetical protein Q4B92_02740 [Ruminococcus sp.]|nr:hypothetical protein [Ruminococcus sp.]
MKIYIASKYIKHSKINRKIFDFLTKKEYDVFLPEAINIEGKTIEEMNLIAQKCYSAIESSDVILVVAPIGRSVSAEIGYAINNKLKFSNVSIILYRYTNGERNIEINEAMIAPFYDYEIDATTMDTNESLNELLDILTSINNK